MPPDSDPEREGRAQERQDAELAQRLQQRMDIEQFMATALQALASDMQGAFGHEGGPRILDLLSALGGDGALFDEPTYEELLELDERNAPVPRGVRPDVLAALPRIQWDADMGGDPPATCAVCLEPLGGTVVLTPCDHFFHDACCAPWWAAHRTCPTCRAEIGG